MIELLMVVTIIGILAAIVLGTTRMAVETSKRKKAEAQIHAISQALESYKIKYGDYPEVAGQSTDPIEGGKMLYQALSGDGTSAINGLPDPVPSNGRAGEQGEILMESLVTAGNQGTGLVDPELYFMRDPWGNPYRYQKGGDGRLTNNPNFDLWSLGTHGDEQDDTKWITNWGQ